MKKLDYAQSTPPSDHSVGTEKLLLSVPETATLLGVSVRTVFLLLSSGELTRRKIRRRTVIHRDDVIRFAAWTSSSALER